MCFAIQGLSQVINITLLGEPLFPKATNLKETTKKNHKFKETKHTTRTQKT